MNRKFYSAVRFLFRCCSFVALIFQTKVKTGRLYPDLRLILLGLCVFAPAFGQVVEQKNAPTFAIEGTVLDRQSRPVANAQVEIHDTNDRILADTQTDVDGNFLILDLGLAPGQYFVQASRLGYRDDEKELKIDLSASPTQRVSLILRPPVISRGIKPEPFVVVRVFYATDRQETRSETLGATYLNARSTDGSLSFGTCEVSIPQTHKPAELERPWLWRLEDPSKHVVLQKVHQSSKDVLLNQVAAQVATSKAKDAFVFIHGYNVSFEEAAQRAAQLAYDLDFKGAPIFYSWPSKGSLLRYRADEEEIPHTVQNLKGFLRDVTERTGAIRVHLIAHSMGNQALLLALQGLDKEASFMNRSEFRQVVLAAPDVDRETFIQLAKEIARPVNRLTLYMSSHDQALMMSHRVVHAQARAGEAGQQPIILAGVDTIDVSSVSTDILGHSYYADSKPIMSDLLHIFNGEGPPRPGLSKAFFGSLAYWTLRPAN